MLNLPIPLAACFLFAAVAAAPQTPPAPAEEPARNSTADLLVTPLNQYGREHLHGFIVLVSPELALGNSLRYRRVMAALSHDLYEISLRVPAPALVALRDIPVVVSATTPSVPGMSGRGMVFHVSSAWLTSSGFDAHREGTVEICNADDFLLWRAEQPFMVLHEFAHGYHWLLGMDRQDVRDAHANAEASGLYRRVSYVLDHPQNKREAYALRNPGEYFAELTEAYFGRNDFFPFTRDELREYDPTGYALVHRLWHLSAAELRAENPDLRRNRRTASRP
ncbi:MAG: hypothetical protein KF866_00830 [Phycisphaeraceae bacterium]|nr:hypothetical protein [Phycisphaeraceae bacterium]MCW5755112.1 hypothetical protein [Phycisphaeraceae bacterium]